MNNIQRGEASEQVVRIQAAIKTLLEIELHKVVGDEHAFDARAHIYTARAAISSFGYMIGAAASEEIGDGSPQDSNNKHDPHEDRENLEPWYT